jgi:hypothetical protein
MASSPVGGHRNSGVAPLVFTAPTTEKPPVRIMSQIEALEQERQFVEEAVREHFRRSQLAGATTTMGGMPAEGMKFTVQDDAESDGSRYSSDSTGQPHAGGDDVPFMLQVPNDSQPWMRPDSATLLGAGAAGTGGARESWMWEAELRGNEVRTGGGDNGAAAAENRRDTAWSDLMSAEKSLWKWNEEEKERNTGPSDRGTEKGVEWVGVGERTGETVMLRF